MSAASLLNAAARAAERAAPFLPGRWGQATGLAAGALAIASEVADVVDTPKGLRIKPARQLIEEAMARRGR